MLQQQSNMKKYNEKIYSFIIKYFKESLNKTINNYSSDFIEKLIENSNEENFSLNIIEKENKLFYSGYPSGNYLKIITKVIEIWADNQQFPFSFLCLPNLEVRYS